MPKILAAHGSAAKDLIRLGFLLHHSDHEADDRREPQEVLRIVYLRDREGAEGGGFYPEGMNGKIRTS